MRRLLGSLLVLAPLLAAFESALLARELPWRGPSSWLFAEAALLWLVLGLLALLPAWLSLRRAVRRARSGGAPPSAAASACTLCAWMLAPVLIHARLDRYTGLDGDLSGWRAPRPWIDLALAALVVGVVLLLATRALRRVPGKRLALGALLGAFAVAAAPFVLARTEVRGSVDASSAEGKPNLLLLVWDTCRASALEVYGQVQPTSPKLSELAGESVLFEAARSASIFTLTSHCSLLTGVYPSTHGTRLLTGTFDPRRASSIATLLARAGYRTGAFVGTDVLAGRTGLCAGFEVYDDRVDPLVCETRAWALVHDLQAALAKLFPSLAANGQPHWFQDFQRPGSEVLREASRWVAEKDERPWFALVNLYDVHWPYLPSEASRAEIVAPYTGPADGFQFRSDRWSAGREIHEGDRRHWLELYHAEVKDLDAAVAAFLDGLDLAHSNTAVVLTADHGEAFGEAGSFGHASVSEMEVHVPLLIRPPGPPRSATRSARRASGIDVAPTLLSLAGLPIPGTMQGIDLLSSAPPERPILVEDRDHVDPLAVTVAYYDGRHKIVRRGLPPEVSWKLYDLEIDPLGEHDIAAANPDLLAELQAELTRLRQAGDTSDAESIPRSRGSSDALRALGYTGR